MFSQSKETLKIQIDHLQTLIARRYQHLPPTGAGLPRFELDEEQTVLAITGLQKYIQILNTADIDELDFANSQSMLKVALKELNIFVSDEILNTITSNDYVEIYTNTFVPIFKSVNFWGNCSYNLDEIYNNPYNQLFSREEFYQASINRAAKRVLSGETTHIENPVPPHIAWEVQGPLKRLVRYKFFSAVFGLNGDILGCLVVSNLTPLEN